MVRAKGLILLTLLEPTAAGHRWAQLAPAPKQFHHAVRRSSFLLRWRGGADEKAVLAVQRLGGWSASEASAALASTNGDVYNAHNFLNDNEAAATKSIRSTGLATLVSEGYDEATAKTALAEAMNNITVARTALSSEAAELADQLEEAVEKMVGAFLNPAVVA